MTIHFFFNNEPTPPKEISEKEMDAWNAHYQERLRLRELRTIDYILLMKSPVEREVHRWAFKAIDDADALQQADEYCVLREKWIALFRADAELRPEENHENQNES